jgi:hypothetical protein
MSAKLSALRSVPRRGLSHAEAAIYVGIGESKFDQLREAGLMPAPRRVGDRKLWDVRELDLAFDALPREATPVGNSWDDA